MEIYQIPKQNTLKRSKQSRNLNLYPRFVVWIIFYIYQASPSILNQPLQLNNTNHIWKHLKLLFLGWSTWSFLFLAVHNGWWPDIPISQGSNYKVTEAASLTSLFLEKEHLVCSNTAVPTAANRHQAKTEIYHEWPVFGVHFSSTVTCPSPIIHSSHIFFVFQ